MELRVFVGGLSRKTTPEALKRGFDKIYAPRAKVVEVEIKKDLHGNSRGFAFVVFDAPVAVPEGGCYVNLHGKRVQVLRAESVDERRRHKQLVAGGELAASPDTSSGVRFGPSSSFCAESSLDESLDSSPSVFGGPGVGPDPEGGDASDSIAYDDGSSSAAAAAAAYYAAVGADPSMYQFVWDERTVASFYLHAAYLQQQQQYLGADPSWYASSDAGVAFPVDPAFAMTSQGAPAESAPHWHPSMYPGAMPNSASTAAAITAIPTATPAAYVGHDHRGAQLRPAF